MRSLLIINVIKVFLCSITAWAAEPGTDHSPLPPEYTYVDHEGYRYSYKTTADVGGTLEVKAPKTDAIVFKETNLEPGGCPGTRFSKPRALKYTPNPKVEIIAICGTDEGHYPTLMLFKYGNLVAKLDYVVTDPNLVWHPEFQTYLAVVLYRENGLFGESTDYLRMVFEWRPYAEDENGFHPIFNTHSYALYLDEYKYYQQQKLVQYLPLLAELVATSKATLICSELAKLPLKKLSQSQLKEYMAINEKHGFPSFDLSICKGIDRR